MTEPEELMQIHRWLSGELSPREAMDITRRALRDPGFRETIEECQRADDAARAAFYADVPGAEALDRGGLPAVRRRGRIEAILKLTSGAGGQGRAARRRWGRWRRPVPTLLATAALALVGVMVAIYLPSGDSQRFRGPVPFEPERVARLRGFKAALGDVAVISPMAGSGGEFVPVDAKGAKDVVLRVTVVRSDDETSESWAVDALIPCGRVVELVTETSSEWRPESLKVSAAGAGDGRTAVTVEARFSADAQVCQTVTLDQAQPEHVAEIKAGHRRFDVYVQAEPASAVGPIM